MLKPAMFWKVQDFDLAHDVAIVQWPSFLASEDSWRGKPLGSHQTGGVEGRRTGIYKGSLQPAVEGIYTQ